MNTSSKELNKTAATVQHGSAINVPVPLIARLMGKSKEFVMQGLRDGVFPWGFRFEKP